MHTLEIQDFKCFKGLHSITLSPLTLLVGVNSAGKTSVIQALNFLHKALNSDAGVINANEAGEDCGFGTGLDLVNDECGTNSFSITLYNDITGASAGATFHAGDDETHALGLIYDTTADGDLDAMGPEFYHLSAERLGPRVSNRMADLPYPDCGLHGEHAAQVLSIKGGIMKVDESRMLPGSTNANVDFQARLWLEHILPGTELMVQSDYDLLRCQTRVRKGHGEERIATNVGFGVSYLLPIIADCLVARKGRFIVIENPEAHLHPAAQTLTGEMLAYMASAGLNIVVETHSEHIVEGVQLFAAKNPEYRQQIAINFFTEADDNNPSVKCITLEEDFRYSDYPPGFLDESAHTYRLLRETVRQEGEK